MKVLESFLIALGIKVDDKSFQKADAAFGGLTKSVLQLGGVLAGKLAIDKVVGDFKSAGTELNNFNKLTGLSTQNVQMLGQAIKAQGGSIQDAFSDLTKIQDLMASPITGNTGWFGDVAKLGLDPDVIIGAQDTAEALANIAEQFETMTPLNQRLAGNALGLSESTVRLLMRGSEEAQKQLDVRGKLGIMTQQQIDDAARLTKASSELDLVFADIGNTIAGELAPAFADMAEDFVAFYRDNKDLIDSGLKEFFGELAENIELVAIAMALLGGSAALKGLASLRAIVGLGSAGAAGAGAGAAGSAGASMLAVAGGSAAALLYSSKLNEGEDTELLNNRLKRGGGEAVGATVDFFMQKGWTREQAEGIAANVDQESGFKANASGDGGQAYGLAQWHPDRQAEFAKKYGKDIRKSTGAEQLEFINHELTRGNERAAGGKLRTANSAYDAASIVSREYERPADKEGEASRRGEKAAGYTDNRQFHIHGADVEKVKQVINEQMSGLTEQTMQDFRSPEK
ncbi:MAG: phage tail tip lysozyme [Pseudomonadota bacterium]|nr:phage tail tip lysozyme [Pseudomonadota bacterium]